MSSPNTIHTTANAGEHYANRANKNYRLGQRMELEDGRIFRHVLCGGSDLVTGNVIQSKAFVSADVRLAVQTAGVVGDTTITITAQGTAAANYYADGWITVTKASIASALNQTYKVKSHPVFAAATKIITLGTNETLRVATTTSDEVALVPNLWDGVIQAPITTLTGVVAGVCHSALTTTYYGWLQTGGVCGVNSAVSSVVGNYNAAVLGAAGQTALHTTAYVGDVDVGINLSVIDTAAEMNAVYLILDE